VPIVRAFDAVAVTVVLPPRLTVEPLIVTLLLVSWALLTVPLKLVVGMVVEAVIADVPLP
jgi:uncharacterized membrane protein